VIVGHNHPGGEPKPSRPDFELTKALSAAGELLGIPVVDHIIVTRNPKRWYSMAKSGTLLQA
jgi:DNA repair protein RadC